MGVEERCIQVWQGSPEGKRPLKNLGIAKRIILKWI
jgi:hypothetical protein